MYRTIANSINYPQWAGTAGSPTRWRSLDQRDRLLDGTFYDHLQYGFYEETRPGTQQKIRLEERRPSSQYHLPRMVARWSARKLWTGRHVPRIRHEDKSVTRVISQLTIASRFNEVMTNATILGSVGSVAIVFRVDPSEEVPQVAFKTWRARDCSPDFDDFNNLTCLRVHYNVRGASLIPLGVRVSADGLEINPDGEYWWVRDYGTQEELSYIPPRVEDWNPVTGWSRQGLSFVPYKIVPHGLGFVPGVWIKNLSGTCGIDGIGTWQDSINISVEIDYLLSQSSRGTRYNCAPELVIVGKLAHSEDEIGRGPEDYIHLEASVKQDNGDSFGESKASLLEMTGEGIKAAQELIDKLRNMALEQIGATRKDPEKLKGVMSGRAMEFLDEDSHDLVMELRSSYGGGALELLRKVVRALGGASGDPKGLILDWPRLYQPTPEDLAHLIPALVQAATPIQEPLDPVEAAKLSAPSGGDGKPAAKSGGSKSSAQKGAGTAGGRPSVKPTGGKSIGALLEVAEASAFLKMNMDIDLLPDEDEEGVSDSDVPTGTHRPPTKLPGAPEELGEGELNMDIPGA